MIDELDPCLVELWWYQVFEHINRSSFVVVIVVVDDAADDHHWLLL